MSLDLLRGEGVNETELNKFLDKGIRHKHNSRSELIRFIESEYIKFRNFIN